MEKKIILITGATNGIGKATAMKLARQGHTIVVHGRDATKTQLLCEEIKAATENDSIDFLLADLLKLSDVKDLAAKFKKKYDRLDVLLNNAGTQYGKDREITPEGHEKTMTVNVMAPMLLSLELLDVLSKSDDARIVTVSSASHAAGGKFYASDIELEHHYSFSTVYGISKLYVIWVMRELEKEIKSRGLNITVNCVHPGSVKSSLGRGANRPFIWDLIFLFWNLFMMNSMEEAISASVYCATADEMKGISGNYYGPKGQEKVHEKKYKQEDAKIVWDYFKKTLKPYL